MIRRFLAYRKLKNAERVFEQTGSLMQYALALGVPDDALFTDVEDILAVRVHDLIETVGGRR